jgi:hypothetical protein
MGTKACGRQKQFMQKNNATEAVHAVCPDLRLMKFKHHACVSSRQWKCDSSAGVVPYSSLISLDSQVWELGLSIPMNLTCMSCHEVYETLRDRA